MAKEFRLQDPGEGIHEAEIREIAVSEGDRIEEGDTVFVVETDKAAVDLPAPYAGTVASIDVSVDDLVEVGDLLMTIDTGEDEAGGEDETGGEEGAAEEEEAAEPEAEEKPAAAEAEAEEAEAEEAEAEETEAEEAEAEEEAAEAEEPKAEAAQEEAAQKETAGKRAGGPVKATPATRRVARELGVDLAAVEPSGPEGRVTEDDVRQAAEGGPPAGKREPEEKEEAPEEAPEEAAAAPAAREAERIPLRSVRRAVARTMAKSWAEIPHVTHHDTVDITELERLRRRHQADRPEDAPRLTLTPFLVKAAAAVLADHRRFNASLDTEADEIVLHPGIHVGIATATERGLLVPVIRDADTKDILTLTAELAELTAAAKDGSLPRERLTGATFSITNVGPLGGTYFTPIINPPQAAILGVGRAALTPVAEGDLDDWGLVARLLMPLSLGFDHRLNDGADAARFVSDLAAVLADPERLLLRA